MRHATAGGTRSSHHTYEPAASCSRDNHASRSGPLGATNLRSLPFLENPYLTRNPEPCGTSCFDTTHPDKGMAPCTCATHGAARVRPPACMTRKAPQRTDLGVNVPGIEGLRCFVPNQEAVSTTASGWAKDAHINNARTCLAAHRTVNPTCAAQLGFS